MTDLNVDKLTPPPELVQQWYKEWTVHLDVNRETHVATQAARWGADTELDACCEWFIRDWTDIETADKLRATRRPKPPSLKEQSLALIDKIQASKQAWDISELDLVRRALESLPND